LYMEDLATLAQKRKRTLAKLYRKARKEENVKHATNRSDFEVQLPTPT
jgi:hypothetical protein